MKEMAQLATSFEEGNTEFLRGRLPIAQLSRRSIDPTSVSSLKGLLAQSGITVRGTPTGSGRGWDLVESGVTH